MMENTTTMPAGAATDAASDLGAKGRPRAAWTRLAAAVPPLVWGVAAVRAVVLLLAAGRYGIFRDELYYLACADHLGWGYVDHPPFSIAVLWLWRGLFGDSVLALQVVPALLGAALVVVAALLARELGGGRFSQTLAAVAVAVVPEYLGLTSFYSMNAFDLLFWVLGAWILVRLVRTGDPRLFLSFGAVMGVGLLNKVSVLFFGFGVAVAIVATPLRRHLRSPWLWLGGGLSFLLFLPHLVWQIRHGWPTLEFIANASRYKIAALSPFEFLGAQILNMHPLTLPIWLAGLGYLLFGREGRRFRVLGVAFLVVLAVLLIQQSKPYYLAAGYTMLYAAGAVAIEAWLRKRQLRWPRPVILSLLLLGGAATAPLAVSLLPVETLIAYQRSLGLAPTPSENNDLGALPQHFADRFGWRQLTAEVAEVYASLPEAERRRATIVTANYGEAGAIDYYGRELGLPPARSQHNSYYLWGLEWAEEAAGDGVVILVGMDPDDEDLRSTFDSLTPAGRLESPYAMPYETRHPIVVARGLRVPLEDAWRMGKHFI